MLLSGTVRRAGGPRILFLLLCIIASCDVTIRQDQQPPAPTISIVLQRHRENLMAIPGVTGVGEGRLKNKPCILVLLSKSTPEIEKRIPAHIEGFPVAIEVVGDVRAH